MLLWHNGVFVDAAAPVFGYADRVRLGDGVFDTMLAVGDGPYHADLHFKRLIEHAETFDIQVKFSVEELSFIARELLEKNKIEEWIIINTIVTRGAGGGLLMPTGQEQVNIFMSLRKLIPFPSEYGAVIAQGVRRNEGSPLSQVKSLNYGDNILALLEARSRGANTALLMNNQGVVVCGADGNVFAVRQGEIYTPPVMDGAMEGIARGLLMKRYKVQEKSLTPEDLYSADCVFITNSVRGAVPLTSLDGKIYDLSKFKIDPAFHLQ